MQGKGLYLSPRLLIIAFANSSLISRWRGMVSVSFPFVYRSCPPPFRFKYHPFFSNNLIKSVRFVFATSCLHLLLYAFNTHKSRVNLQYFTFLYIKKEPRAIKLSAFFYFFNNSFTLACTFL